MKRLVILALIAISAISCDLGEEDKTQFVLGPIQDVTMASAYKVDSVSVITIRCVRPTDCHIVNGFFYDINGFTRTVAMEFAVTDGDNCQPETYPYEVPLNFKPTTPGTYLFRFWDGQNQDGTDHFYEAEAVVPE